MKYLNSLILIAGLCISFALTPAQAQLNVNFVGNLNYSQDLSDIWGYSAGGREYALVGLFNGVSIVDVTNPSSPVEVDFVSGANSIWRDLKTWNNYAYVTNETSGGLQIINLSGLPGSVSAVNFNDGWTKAHNIYIDENGIAYVCGANIATGGVRMYDVDANSTNPPLVGSYEVNYVHDLFVRGDTMYTGEIFAGRFAIVDVSVKSSPVILGTQNSPSNFTHNVWLSQDGSTVFTTDETSNAPVGAYDITDVSDITELDQYKSNPGSNSIPHNVIVKDNFFLVAWYRDGLRIVDATQPQNLIEVGYYDTSPLSGNGFNGAWGVYPYLPSGNVLVADIENGLFVLQPTYTGAAYVEGVVTEDGSGFPLFNVDVSISGTPEANTSSSITGNYETGVATGGSYDITFSKSGYLPTVISGVSLINGNTATVDVQLVPATAFTVSGQVLDSATSLGVANAEILIANTFESYTTTTDGSGNFVIPSFVPGTYSVAAGKWTYKSKELIGQNINTGSGPVSIEIAQGIYDDFTFDFGWTKINTATTGRWVIGEPEGTISGSDQANPEFDVTGDISDQCYMTGNGGGAVGNDDVDDGKTILKSPIFSLSSASDPFLNYSRWFFNGGGSGTPNDSLIVKISNGITTATVDIVLDGDQESQWVNESFRILDYVSLTANMQLIFEAGDQNATGHLVEAGIDLVRITDGGTPSSCNIPINLQANVTTNSVTLSWDAVPDAFGYQIKGRPLGASGFGTTTSGTNSKSVGGLNSGSTYEWKVRAGCPTDTTEFSPLVSFTTLSLKEEGIIQDLSLFPAVTSQSISLSNTIDSDGEYSIQILDIYGRQVFSEEYSFEKGTIRIELSVQDFANGNYILDFHGKDKHQIARFTVLKSN